MTAEKFYKDQITKLFNQWKQKEIHANSVFIEDGIVCPEQWFSNKKRPLFLLKEAYGEEEDWDLIKNHLCSNIKMGKLWLRVAEWTHGILNCDEQMLPYKKMSHQNFSECEDLKNIAVINVKKSNGKKDSNYHDILFYAKKDKKELWQEIELCDPTVIICGYTSSALEIISGQNFREKKNENLFYHINLNGHDVLVYDYWHPANHYPDLMNYYGLMNIDFLANLKSKGKD